LIRVRVATLVCKRLCSDLKPQNVLLDHNRIAKVCDFGASKAIETGRDMTLGVGTVAYMPPEVMNEFQDSNTTAVLDAPKCDVFSFAVLALYTVTAVMPHEGLKNKDIFVKVGMTGKRTAVPPGYFQSDENPALSETFPDFVELLERMWDQQPSERPPFAIILPEITDAFTPKLTHTSIKELAGETRPSATSNASDMSRFATNGSSSSEESSDDKRDESSSDQGSSDEESSTA